MSVTTDPVGNARKGSATYWTPERRREAEEINDQRVRIARNHFGRITLRFLTTIMQPHHTKRGTAAMALRGQGFMVRVDEALDVWAFLRDLKAFARGWRPERRRTPAGVDACRRILEDWQKQADQVR